MKIGNIDRSRYLPYKMRKFAKGKSHLFNTENEDSIRFGWKFGHRYICIILWTVAKNLQKLVHFFSSLSVENLCGHCANIKIYFITELINLFHKRTDMLSTPYPKISRKNPNFHISHRKYRKHCNIVQADDSYFDSEKFSLKCFIHAKSSC